MVPKFLGGLNEQNMQRLCLNCHRAKSLYESIFLQPLKQELKEILDKISKHGVVELRASTLDCAGESIGSLIKRFNIDKARTLMEQHFANRRTQKKKRKRTRTNTVIISTQ